MRLAFSYRSKGARRSGRLDIPSVLFHSSCAFGCFGIGARADVLVASTYHPSFSHSFIMRLAFDIGGTRARAIWAASTPSLFHIPPSCVWLLVGHRSKNTAIGAVIPFLLSHSSIMRLAFDIRRNKGRAIRAHSLDVYIPKHPPLFRLRLPSFCVCRF